jgi:hypothetical protein
VDDISPNAKGPTEVLRYTVDTVAVIFEVKVDIFPNLPYSINPF